MNAFVADTHALAWHLMEPRRLGKEARRQFQRADAAKVTCFVPAIAIVEIALLHERGRLRLGAAHVLAALAGHSGYSLLPLDVEQVVSFSHLVAVRDPMDRLILAAAVALGVPVVSADEALSVSGVSRLWD